MSIPVAEMLTIGIVRSAEPVNKVVPIADNPPAGMAVMAAEPVVNVLPLAVNELVAPAARMSKFALPEVKIGSYKTVSG